MSLSPMSRIRILAVPVLIAALLAPVRLTAADHVVSAAEIQKRILTQAQEKQANLNRVQEFFASEPASRILQNVPAVRNQIERAVPQLDGQELAQMAAKISKVQRDFAAGALTNQQLTYIVIALATAVIILVIVES